MGEDFGGEAGASVGGRLRNRLAALRVPLTAAAAEAGVCDGGAVTLAASREAGWAGLPTVRRGLYEARDRSKTCRLALGLSNRWDGYDCTSR